MALTFRSVFKSDVFKGIVGAAAVAASFIPGVGQVVAAGLRLGGIGFLSDAVGRGASSGQEGVRTNIPSNVAPVPVVYGTAKLGVRPVDVRQEGAHPKHLWLVAAICHGSRNDGDIENIDKVWFDERLAVDDGVVESDFSGKLNYYEELGSTSQNVIGDLNSTFATAWPATSRGKGIAYIALEFIFDKGVYPNGIPNITVQVQGNKVYDHRDTNWKHSDNPALCVRDYLLSEVYGGRIPAGEIDEDSFDDMADFCDELVSVPDGEGGSENQKRFTLNGWVDTSRDPWENLSMMLSSCRGIIYRDNGVYRLHIPRAVTPETFELDESNIVGDWEFAQAGLESVANIVRGTFMNLDKDWQPDQVQWPEVGESNTYLTNDNNFESAREIELPFTTNSYMAEQICQVALNESRQPLSCLVTVKEEALKLQCGEVVQVTHETPGWDQKQFWVEALWIVQQGLVRLALREYDSSAYSYDTMSDASALPDTSLPDPFSAVAPTGLTLLSDATTRLTGGVGEPVPRIKVTWTWPDEAFTDYVDVFARINGSGDWEWVKRVDANDDALAYVAEVSAGETWQVGIRAVNTIGVPSTVVTDTVAIPAATEIEHVNDPPSAPTLVTLSCDMDTLEVV